MFLALAGIGAIVTDLLSGLLFFVAAAVVLPPFNRFLKTRLNFVMSWKAKAWLVLGLLGGAALASVAGEKRDSARAADTSAEALRADFAANGPAIRMRMDSALKARNYALAVSIGQKYIAAVRDPQLAKLYTEAQAGQKREADSAKEQELLARAGSLPASDLEGNRDVYRQLLMVNPTNPTYKTKYDTYNDRIRQSEAAEQDRVRRFGPLPQASAWNGTYSEVKDYLQRVMNDPESLEMDACTKVYHVESGWLVGCDYRGRNAFGGMIRQSNWFIIRNGGVVEMKEASAYRP